MKNRSNLMFKRIFKRRHKFLQIAWSYDRTGGIQEVCYQVKKSLSLSDAIQAKSIVFLTGRKKFLSILKIFFYRLIGYTPVVMHPYIFSRLPFKKFLKAIVWAYGIDVWGEYGKSKSRNLDQSMFIFSISNFTCSCVKSNWPTAKTKVLHLGADFVRNDLRVEDRESKLSLLTVARLDSSEQYKGHDLSLNALSLLKRDGFEFRYNIVGDGDDRNRLERLVVDLDLSDCVEFHGFLSQDDVAELMASSSLFLMPSFVVESPLSMWKGEGFGLVYVEAALCAVPSIACDVGGQTDFVEDNVNGFLVKPTVDSVYKALRRAAENPSLLRDLGQSAYHKAISEFTYDAFSKRLHDALLELA